MKCRTPTEEDGCCAMRIRLCLVRAVNHCCATSRPRGLIRLGILWLGFCLFILSGSVVNDRFGMFWLFATTTSNISFFPRVGHPFSKPHVKLLDSNSQTSHQIGPHYRKSTARPGWFGRREIYAHGRQVTERACVALCGICLCAHGK